MGLKMIPMTKRKIVILSQFCAVVLWMLYLATRLNNPFTTDTFISLTKTRPSAPTQTHASGVHGGSSGSGSLRAHQKPQVTLGADSNSKGDDDTATANKQDGNRDDDATNKTTTPGSRLAKAISLLPSILDPSDASVDRMTCPPVNATRYGHLRGPPSAPELENEQRFLFALNLRQCVDLLPRLMGSLLEAMRFLGPRHCALSIVEGNSDDGTLEVLRLLEEELKAMGVGYWLTTSSLDPSKGERIQRLALLRQLAVEPLVKGGLLSSRLSPDATVLFINDVAACAEDLLELAHQRRLQSADMVCAMDWSHPGAGLDDDNLPFFYDVWVARAINGDLFFDIPAGTGGWEKGQDLFFNEPVARQRMAAGVPFQVFACWNGATAFAAEPLASGDVSFRWPAKDECFQGEPQLFCKDLWWKGYGKIAVVPSVNLEYTDTKGRQTKRQKGYVSEFVSGERPRKKISVWKGPPDMVKCMPGFSDQTWLPWNETLVEMTL
ncbi:alpha-1,3-mannosyltransferase CMT1 [Lasiosphaeria hispida]|uniref:Alpha-1,3-mannosyltransferase CMT1 n=1 Tax=Lasiosphaeria hispida TaxID=260671 RepID=A0AAJ0MEQ6_9PEZI|nr:alpha-1,3-mannosyltransferase CMT1 [Lasiosphaeria hispida]